MEHRHFPRKPVDVAVQLSTIHGKTYDARLLELSAIGMRIVLQEVLPERVKLVDVFLPRMDQNGDSPYRRLRMFVARRDECVLGLCLVNERTRIDVDRYQLCTTSFFKGYRLVNQ